MAIGFWVRRSRLSAGQPGRRRTAWPRVDGVDHSLVCHVVISHEVHGTIGSIDQDFAKFDFEDGFRVVFTIEDEVLVESQMVM